jgi:hypothetical protein
LYNTNHRTELLKEIAGCVSVVGLKVRPGTHPMYISFTLRYITLILFQCCFARFVYLKQLESSIVRNCSSEIARIFHSNVVNRFFHTPSYSRHVIADITVICQLYFCRVFPFLLSLSNNTHTNTHGHRIILRRLHFTAWTHSSTLFIFPSLVSSASPSSLSTIRQKVSDL